MRQLRPRRIDCQGKVKHRQRFGISTIWPEPGPPSFHTNLFHAHTHDPTQSHPCLHTLRVPARLHKRVKGNTENDYMSREKSDYLRIWGRSIGIYRCSFQKKRWAEREHEDPHRHPMNTMPHCSWSDDEEMCQGRRPRECAWWRLRM